MATSPTLSITASRIGPRSERSPTSARETAGVVATSIGNCGGAPLIPLRAPTPTRGGCALIDPMEMWPGRAYPLGATFDGTGTNFALFSEVAEQVHLCLFDPDGSERRGGVTEADGHGRHADPPGVEPPPPHRYPGHGPPQPPPGARGNPPQTP